MIALSILFIGIIWLLIGYLIWRVTFKKIIKSKITQVVFGLVLIPVWFVGPFIDEILGGRKFEELCQQLPPVYFSGPIDVGPGKFFDKDGKQQWKDDEDFAAHYWKQKEWNELFEDKSSWPLITNWPMPIGEYRTEVLEKKTGRVIILSRTILSPGGWLSRAFGLNFLFRSYSCRNRGYPRSWKLLKFEQQ